MQLTKAVLLHIDVLTDLRLRELKAHTFEPTSNFIRRAITEALNKLEAPKAEQTPA
jgi:hypothetical protein